MGFSQKFSLLALFGGLAVGLSVSAGAADMPAQAASPWTGFIQGEVARAYRDPEHWSKGRLRLELNRRGKFSENVKWKIGGRFDYDAAYDRSSF